MASICIYNKIQTLKIACNNLNDIALTLKEIMGKFGTQALQIFISMQLYIVLSWIKKNLKREYEEDWLQKLKLDWWVRDNLS